MGKTAFLLASALALASCGGTGQGPFSWFGRPAETDAAALGTSVDPRPLIDRVEDLAVLPTSDGAVLRATGIAPVQGFWNGALVPVETGQASVLAYAFRAEPPAAPDRVSTERSREVTVAVELSADALAGIREIRVTGARNSQIVRR